MGIDYSLKKIIFFLISIFFILACIIFYFLFYKNRIVSVQFNGGLKSLIQPSSILVQGGYFSKTNPEIINVDKTMTIVIDENTVFTKTIIYLPTQEELKLTKGYFNGKDLKRDTINSDSQTFAKDISNTTQHINIFAKSKKNIYGKDSFVATEIKYEIPQ